MSHLRDGPVVTVPLPKNIVPVTGVWNPLLPSSPLIKNPRSFLLNKVYIYIHIYIYKYAEELLVCPLFGLFERCSFVHRFVKISFLQQPKAN